LPWLVSIIDNKTFPDNVKVLNCIYDFQLELAGTQKGQAESIQHDTNAFVYGALTVDKDLILQERFLDLCKR
jgi:hypothetical protein